MFISTLRNSIPFDVVRAAALVSAFALAPRSASATDYVNDPLTDGSSPGLGVRGGSFSPSGWTTTGPADTLWFTITAPLESGSMSFDVTGIGICQSNCTGDVDLFTLYQQPDGMAQPIDYSPGYRNNDQRVFVRMFQNGAGDSLSGAMKMEIAGCPVGPPYYDNSCPSSCSPLDDIAYCGGRMSDCGWDAAHTYHFELDWGGGTMTYSRDGTALGSIGYPSTFAPQPLVVQLGSPRNGQVGGSGMTSGLTFANLVVSGAEGVRTPSCSTPPPPPDAGPPAVIPCTDGSVGASADVTAASWTPGVFQDPSDLNVEGDGAGNASAIVYMAFPPPATTAAQATLTLHTRTNSSAAGGSGQVCATDGAPWDESSLTWSSRPAVTALCSGGARRVTPDEDVTWDVTALVNSGATSFALVSTDGDGAHFESRESGGCGRGPHLLVIPTASATTGTSGASASTTSTTGGGATTSGSAASSTTTATGTSGSGSATATGTTTGADGSTTVRGSGAASTGTSPAPQTVTSGCSSGGAGFAWPSLCLVALLGLRRGRFLDAL